MALVHDMRTYCRRAGLSMCTSHAQSFVRTGQSNEHLRPFLYLETTLTEKLQFLMSGRNGRSVNHKT